MPQETNFNVSPYFDDFEKSKDYYKVLFKPGYPVQARELTTLQSMLQNQVEQFGKHIFKEGSVVIPGQLKYDNPINCVEIDPSFNGLPISLYFDSFVGQKIRGSVSGVSAQIFSTLKDTESERGNYTLYVKYLESGGVDFNNKTFQDGETLILENTLKYGNNYVIQSGQGICNTISSNCTSKGSSVSVASGVYFVRGIFANVNEQTIILDQYSTNPSYKIGFDVVERIVTSDEDESLYDNARNFSNYTAPGADRFQLKLELTKKLLTETEIDNFVEILRVENGVPTFFDKNPTYNLIRDELARRTFDESGNYFVKPFDIFVRDSLNDRVLTNGIYFNDQTTLSGNTPSEETMVYQIGPGKAYVNGYDVETITAKLLDVPKPRTTKTVSNELIPYNAGTLLVLNNIFGSPSIGIGTNAVLSLMDSRLGSDRHVAAGTTIGVARIYDYVPETNSDYIQEVETFRKRSFVRLFDIQTYTRVTLTTAITLSQSTHIEGKRSGATAFLKESVTSSADLVLYEVSGQFIKNEPILINGIENGRLILDITDYSLNDIKSVYSPKSIGISTFNADVVLNSKSYIAKPGTSFKITAGSGGISTVSAGLDNTFNTVLKEGDIISYFDLNSNFDVFYNRVNSVSAGGTEFTINAVEGIPGLNAGYLPLNDVEVNNIIKITPTVYSKDSSLLTKLNKTNVENFGLENSQITQRRFFRNVAFSGYRIAVTIDALDTDVYFDAFDEDKFVITYDDGTKEDVRFDKYQISTSGKTIYFNDLSKENGVADVIATVVNLKPNSKTKKLNRVGSLTIPYSKYTASGIGSTTLNDGLTYSSIYGTRVQDREVCLNVPDVVRVLAVYESFGTGEPLLPALQLISLTGQSGTTSDFIVGERIRGKTSGSVGLITKALDSDKIEYVYLNTFQFTEGEIIVGEESSIEGTVVNIRSSHKNITQNYTFDDGQRSTIYDYSRIVRKANVDHPNRTLKVIYQYYTIDSTDTGEFISVNSYPSDSFKHDVPLFENTRLTDYIDIRPRVAPYVYGSTTKSPFEFGSRNFASDGQYSKYILVPGENIVCSYSYYLGRIDRVFLNSDGTFEISQGTPSEDPVPPLIKSNSLDIATIYIPPYVYNVDNIKVDITEHKRYRMEDIALLENRIERVEKYTTLSMLESKTENFTIRDAETGLDRFKCGFFVDNFSTHDYHDLTNPNFKSSIDTNANILRPSHYTTSLDLQLGSEVIAGFGQTYLPNKDHSYVDDLGSPGVKKTGDLITLDYNTVLYFEQPYATKTESVTPFLVKYWTGSIELNPPLDNWVEERLIVNRSQNTVTRTLTPLPDINVTLVNNVVNNRTVFTNPVQVQTGIPQFDWIANARSILTKIQSRRGSIGGIEVSQAINGQRGNRLSRSGIIQNDTIHLEVWKNSVTTADKDLIRQLLPTDVANSFITQIETKNLNRRVLIDFTPGSAPVINQTVSNSTSTQTTSSTSSIIIPPEVNVTETSTESSSNYTEPIIYLRSRNIEFDVKGLRPVTRFYPFFEGINVSSYIIPKLLEIEMVSGKFQTGEIVESDPHFVSNKFRFRLCKPSHKEGLHDNPSQEYKLIPYTQTVPPSSYTESSTFLNVDTKSLQLPSEVEFYGSISQNMTLIGKTSKAVARIKNIRLVSDLTGRLIGSLFIPDPKITGNPKWINGQNTFTVIDTPVLSQLINENGTTVSESSAEAEFTSSAVTNVKETRILTTRNVSIRPGRNINTTTITNTTTNTTTVSQTASGGANNQVRIWETHDPLAQSFYVREDTGIFLTGVDVFFQTVDESIPVTLQIRPMIAGVPSTIVIPFSEVTLTPDQINLSTDGSVPTRFTFPSPVYLSGPQQLEVRQSPVGSQQTSEYSVVLLSNSPNYRVFVCELGQTDIQTKIKVGQQPTLGSLFKSQNGSTWTPTQLEDLKYRLYRADFVSEGIVRFFNPRLSLKNKKVTVTGENQLLPLSKRAVLGLGTVTDFQYPPEVVPGITILQDGTKATSKLIGIGGSVAVGGGVTVSNVGVGYTDGTFTGIQLINETGYGKGIVADIVVSSNKINSVTITNGGYGYQIGDSLLIPNIGQNVGFGGKVVVNSISSNNALVVDNINYGLYQIGETPLSYIRSSGITTWVGAGLTITSIDYDPYYDGLHMKVTHINHGMHSQSNFVKISDVRPMEEEPHTKLSQALTITEQSALYIDDPTGFETFEGLEIGGLNPGFVVIGQEVVGYTSITALSPSGGILRNLTRGVDASEIQAYDTQIPVYKYEMNGVSLRRINKVHTIAESNVSTHPIDLNSYYIKITQDALDFDGSVVGSSRADSLYFNRTRQLGKEGALLSNNIQYEAITPNVACIIPSKTDINTRLRSFTGTSVSGDEVSFEDNGYVDIPLDQTTFFGKPQLICSEVNENRLIEGSPGNRSLTMEFVMRTSDSRVSPVVDTIRTSVVLTSNLVNAPAGINKDSTYADVEFVRGLDGDKHDAIYISKPVFLKLPANSLKVLLTASRNDMNDVRVLYQLFREDSSESSINYELFPGYSNYRIDGNGVKKVIDSSRNDGSSDSEVSQSSDRSFRDYEYSVDDLPEFTGFAIKIVMASKNQATPPLLKQLRAIATIKPKV